MRDRVLDPVILRTCTISDALKYRCSVCHSFHDGPPLSYGADAPHHFYQVAPEEREQRVHLSSDQCIIDNEFFFVRSCLEIPILESAEALVWGVWVSLSEKSFDRMNELWTNSGRESELPYFGWLSTEIPSYPSTLNLKTQVHTQPVGERPLIELEPSDHPLAIDQRDGISMARVQEIAELLLHRS